MEAFKEHVGFVVPLDRINVDTDQIIPKQFLKRIERTGFGEFLFYDWRYLENGDPNPEFVLNDPRYADASILVAGVNFGCGSSREHAPWALQQYGFKAILAPLVRRRYFSVTTAIKTVSSRLDLVCRRYCIAQPRGTGHRGLPTDDRLGGAIGHLS